MLTTRPCSAQCQHVICILSRSPPTGSVAVASFSRSGVKLWQAEDQRAAWATIEGLSSPGSDVEQSVDIRAAFETSVHPALQSVLCSLSSPKYPLPSLLLIEFGAKLVTPSCARVVDQNVKNVGALFDLFNQRNATRLGRNVGDDVLALARSILGQALSNFFQLFLFARCDVNVGSVVHESSCHHPGRSRAGPNKPMMR